MDALYLEDCYMKNFNAVVEEANKRFIVLDKTAFYPNSGGQPYDTGKIIDEKGNEYKVVYVGKFNGKISHEVDKEGLKKGDKVKGIIDWDRRYRLMRYHTAAHILSEVIHKETNARVTGNQLSLEKARIDFDLPEFDKEKIKEYEKKANEVISKGLEVKKYFLPREEALKNRDLFTLKNVLPPNVDNIRIVEVVGFDISACGGTHVDNTKEIKGIEIIKAENKGRENRRIYFKLVD